MRDQYYRSEMLHIGKPESEFKDGLDSDGNWLHESCRGKVYLDHQCDEWIIGGKEEVELLIADLQKVLEDLK